MSIPKIIHQVWIGPLDPPLKWMDTWVSKNPDWEYRYWDNDAVFSRRWKNQHLLDEYKKRAEDTVTFLSAKGNEYVDEKATLFAWHVMADIIRYEILYEYGGYMPGADTLCLRPLTGSAEWLEADLYTVNTGHIYENEYLKLKPDNKNYNLLKGRYHPGNASPILASSKGNEWLGIVISELGKITHLGEAVDTTGNVFMGRMLRTYPPENIIIKPYLKKRDRGRGVYSMHYSGTTRGSYKKGRR